MRCKGSPFRYHLDSRSKKISNYKETNPRLGHIDVHDRVANYIKKNTLSRQLSNIVTSSYLSHNASVKKMYMLIINSIAK